MKLYEYYNEFGFDYSNIYQKISDVDSVFVGKVIKLEETIKVNKHGFDEVFSLFTIEVINVLKGDILDSVINLVFFGGIVDETLYVSDYNQRNLEEIIPLFGEYYLISCNYYPYFNTGNLNLKDIYYVINPYSMLYLYDFSSNSKVSEKIISDHIDAINNLGSIQDDTFVSFAANYIEPPGDDGGTIIPGSSFETAIPIIEGLNLSGYIFDSSNPVYFEFQVTSSELVTIESSYNYYNTDVKGTLYTSGGGMILSYDEDSGYADNFLIEKILVPGYYIIAVESESTWLPSGDFYIEYNYDSDCHCDNYVFDLLNEFNYDAVSFINTLILDSLLFEPATTYSSELEDAIDQWNSLGYVDISYEPNLTIAGDGFVNVYDIDNEYGSVAMFIPVLNRIYFNSFFFDTWTYSERLKTVMHEIGHALGINEFNTSDYIVLPLPEDLINVMRQGRRELTELGPCDRLVYLYKWGHY